MTRRMLSKFDFTMVRFGGKWEVLPKSYEVEQIINLMSKDGSYQKCVKDAFDWWKDSLSNEANWDDSLMRCVRDHLATKLNEKILIHEDL